jgi:hypothetical protein
MRIALLLLHALAAQVFLVPFAHAAGLVEIKWNDSGRFSHSASVQPGKFLEVCGPLKAKENIGWKFAAAKPVDFNIHYHEGEKVVFPEKRDAAASAESRLAIAVDQDYCWMWQNKSDGPVGLKVEFNRR